MLFSLGTLLAFELDLVTMLGTEGTAPCWLLTANPDLGPPAGLDTIGTVIGA